MKDLIQSVWKLMTGDLEPEERKAMNGALLKVGWRGALVFHVLWACGWLAFAGIGAGFAKAEDAERKIEKAIEPVMAEQAEQRALLTNLTDTIADQLASGIASEIRYLYAKKCKEEDYRERDRLQGEIDRKQHEYFKYRKTRYQYDCRDI